MLQVVLGNTGTKQVGNTKTKQVVIGSGAISSGTKQVNIGGSKQVMGGSVVGIQTGKPGIKGSFFGAAAPIGDEVL